MNHLACFWLSHFLLLLLLGRTATGQQFTPFDATPPEEEPDENLIFNADTYNAPLIEPTRQDVTAEAGRRFELRCRSISPVTWVREPAGTDEPPRPDNFDLEHLLDANSLRPYGATLRFDSVEVDHVGWYYCIRNNSLFFDDVRFDKEVELFRASKIYLFVRNTRELILPVYNPFISVQQYSDVVIPCKPVNKEVSLRLLKDEQESAVPRFTYDPKEGFKFKAREVGDSGVYRCELRDGNAYGEDLNVQVLHSYNELEALTEYVERPVLTSPSKGFAIENDPLELTCSVGIGSGILFQLTWKLPDGTNAETAKKSAGITVSKTSSYPNSNDTNKIIGKRTLRIAKANRLQHSGTYLCIVQDHNGHTNQNSMQVNVLPPGEAVLWMDLMQRQQREVVIKANPRGSFKFLVNYTAYPDPSFNLYFNEHLVPFSDKYNITVDKKEVVVKIMAPELFDTGTYMLVANNYYKMVNVTLKLFVRAPPTVRIENNVYLKYGEKTNLTCHAVGYPHSEFFWSFEKCKLTPQWPNCGPQLDSRSGVPDEELQGDHSIMTRDYIHQTDIVKFEGVVPGRAICTAENSEGADRAFAYIMIIDIDEPFHIWKEAPTEPITTGENVKLHCGANVYNYSGEIGWYKDGSRVRNTSGILVEQTKTEYSFRRTITFSSVQLTHDGEYECRARLVSGDFQIKTIHLDVSNPVKPDIYETNMTEGELMHRLGDTLTLYCLTTGIPKPQVLWYKDGIRIDPDENNTHIRFNNDFQEMKFQSVLLEDEGEYKCEASNKEGYVTRMTNIRVTNVSKPIKLGVLLGIAFLVLGLLIISIYLCFRVRREKKIIKRLKAAGLEHFETGAVDQLNPDLNLNEQAEFLPYDRKFEFPREKLKLGKQLGAGAFGVVVKAMAQGIVPYEDETPVAVKMVKAQTNDEIMRALISELKIMVHLGRHLNVVNLLGAVTQNIAQREMMVIVEYCRFGNIQKFLLKHRPYFIDQIDKETDNINPEITENELRWSNNSAFHRASSRSSGGVVNPIINSKGYVARNSGLHNMAVGVDSANTEATLISSIAEDEGIGSGENPNWGSNYQSDYKGPARTVTTSDLVVWAFQVARGMDYLASRKVLHGDLAARNILLCDENVVKICDFGLSRSLYSNENYKKQNDTPLPFKWLALESLSDQVFSTYSDIWAFGIVLWEFFSLAKTPYPGMDANRDLYLKLMDGYRMEKPKYANDAIYEIMLSCWRAKPDTRPQFNELEKQLGVLLDENLKDLYVDLNEPYLQANADEMAKGKPDYLAMLGPPEEMAPHAPPIYISDQPPTSQAPGRNDYLLMTPRKERKEADSSPSQGSQRAPKADEEAPEEIPMLKKSPRAGHRVRDVPESERKPAPRISKPNGEQAPGYVNVPSQTNRFGAQDAISNPSYVLMNETST